MYGALVIEAQDDPVQKVFPYDREYTFVLSEADGFVMTVIPSGVQVNEGDAVATIR